MSFVGFYASVPAGRTIPHDIIARPAIALPMLAGFICGIAAFFTGTIGIKRKDTSILLFLSTAMGFFVLLWCLAEIAFPH
jgi:hypothetical protein